MNRCSCGGKVVLNNESQWHYVKCLKCWSKTGHYLHADDAIAAWDRRS